MTQWYEPADPTPREICPCCDYVTLPERGNYLICPVCFWEDDGTNRLNKVSGANKGITLRRARGNFKRFGAFDQQFLPNVCSAADRSKYIYKPRDLKE